MIKYLSTICAIVVSLPLFAQRELIYTHGFEPLGDSWSPLDLSTPTCSSGGDTWGPVQNLGQIEPSQGELFWGIEDLNGECGSSGFEWILLPEVDIDQYQEVSLSFDLWVEGFDNGDDIEYQLTLDGAAQDRVLLIEGASDYSTGGWIQIEIPIANSHNRVGLKILVKQNGSDRAGIDNIALRGYPVSGCTEPFISEYLEGSSSGTHRNNYIELYNPSDSWVSLQGYSLVKFTGAQTEVSASLNLRDSIAPFGNYLIEDDQETLNVEADLSTNSAVMNFNGDDKIALSRQGRLIDLVGVVGDSLDFARDVTLRRRSWVNGPNSQFNQEEWDVYALEDIGDIGRHASTCQGPLPEISIMANGIEIPDGNLSTSKINNTYFGYLPVNLNSSRTLEFEARNTGNAPLQIVEVSLSGPGKDAYALISSEPITLQPGQSHVFSVVFSPDMMGMFGATLHLANNDPSEGSYDILLQGEGSGPSLGPLIISQYYEGEGNNRWLELTNTSGEVLEEGSFYLALFRQDLLDHPIGSKPSIKRAIPKLEPGETILFRASLNVDAPSYALNGQEIPTGVCGFTGDDVLVISASGGTSCWQDRTDIIGRQGNWGTDLSYVRRYGCEVKGPNTGFSSADWLPYAVAEIDSARSGHNARLGEHASGMTAFEHGNWSDGLPDLNKSVEIRANYLTAEQGDLEACSLRIGEGARVVVGQNHHLVVQEDLEVYGQLVLENGASLMMINDSGRIINRGSIVVQKESATLKPYDYTYWSSPVASASLDTVFKASPADYRFYYVTRLFEDTDGDGENDTAEVWQKASGLMTTGKGYAVMAPDNISAGDTQQVNFQGTPNNGQLFLPALLQGQADGDNDWNLIGNPYPSAIDLETFLKDPHNDPILGGSCYFWTHNSSFDAQGNYSADDYAIYTSGIGGVRASSGGTTPDRFVGSGQGFFVEATSHGELKWNNAMRALADKVNFYRTKQPKGAVAADRLWLNLSTADGHFNQILVGFAEKATPGYDKDYDAIRLSANPWLSFYSPLEHKRLAIRGEPAFQDSIGIPLGLEVKKEMSGLLEISLENPEGRLRDHPIYLYDRELDQVHELDKSAYTFIAPEPARYDHRFHLTFISPGKTQTTFLDNAPKIMWERQGDMLQVWCSNGQVIEKAALYDLLGRNVHAIEGGKKNVSFGLSGMAANSVYILRAKTVDGRMLSTKILALRP